MFGKQGPKPSAYFHTQTVLCKHGFSFSPVGEIQNSCPEAVDSTRDAASAMLHVDLSKRLSSLCQPVTARDATATGTTSDFARPIQI